jgi:prolyl oligopeptidase
MHHLMTLWLSLAMLVCLVALAAAVEVPRPPSTKRVNVTETIHGVTVTDPYRWLEDQDSPDTRAWIEAQNAYARALLDPLPARQRLAARFEQLLRVDRTGMPTVRNGRYFFGRKRVQDEQAILYWRRGLHGKDRVLFDPNPLTPDHSSSVSLMDVSLDGRRAAVGVQQGGQDEVEVRILDVDGGKELPDRLPRSHVESISFIADASGFYYSHLIPLQGRRIYFHRMGTDPAADPVIFGAEYGPDTMVEESISEDGRWLAILVYRGWSQNDVFVQDLKEGGPIRPIVVGVDATFGPVFAGDRLLMLTDYHAPRRRVLEADPHGTRPLDQWHEVIAEGDQPIEDFAASAGKLFVVHLRDVSSRVEMYEPDGKPCGEVRLPGIGGASVPEGPWGGHEAFYAYESFASPPQVRRIETPSGRQSVWSRIKVPFKSADFITRQVWYSSKDGTRIPMFLVHRKGLKLDGDRPVHLTGYGGFGVSMTPAFDPEAALWVESGGVFAVPSLRGGGEFGEEWHRAGMLDKKQNVFDDFIAAAQCLIDNRYARPERLVISGGSNGGLLVGAAMVQRPELFAAVLCEVPLLDMLRYHLFLQGPQWVPEYGSADDPAQFRVLYAYSPYHHVDPKRSYPAVLFVTGDADTRVAPLHARKMTALLQSLPNQTKPVMLYYETEVGHSGGEPVSKQVDRRSHVQAFLFHEAGLDQ